MQTPSQNADATNNTQSPGGFFYSSLRSNGGSNSNLVRVLTPKSENSKLQIKENGQKTRLEKNREPLKLKGYVGFDKLATQYVQKQVKDGFAFNILCIGETGIGKSTLMDTLFNTSFNLTPSSHNEPRVFLNANSFELNENDIKLKLTLIETCGYGDQINKENSHEEIINYVNVQYEKYVQEELNLKRSFKQISDTRVHVCLYFICPTGHSLKAIDLNTMKALDRKVNIIPIIAKADTVGKNELGEFKRRVMNELANNQINIYQFPINDYDLSVNNSNATANGLYPLAVIGSVDMVKIGSKLTRGRSYEWGTVSVENETHCDFIKFREMLLSTNMLDLIEVTHAKHYQLYRSQRLKEIGFSEEDELELESSNSGRSVQDVYNMKREEFEDGMQAKEMDIKESFIRKVKEKEVEIREIEKNLNDKYNQWKKGQLEWSDRLEQKRKELEDEMKGFNDRKYTLERSKFTTLTANGKLGKNKK